jgi:hypothetical protein
VQVTIEYSNEEKQEVIAKLKALAVAQAEFWDLLREIEEAHECEIKFDPALVSELAEGCNIPPSFTDLNDDELWATFQERSAAEQ